MKHFHGYTETRSGNIKLSVHKLDEISDALFLAKKMRESSRDPRFIYEVGAWECPVEKCDMNAVIRKGKIVLSELIIDED